MDEKSGSAELPAGSEDQSPADTQTDQQQGGDETVSKKEYREKLRENQQLRSRLKALEDGEKSRKEGEESELQQLRRELEERTRERDDLLNKHQQSRLREAVSSAASRAGAIEPGAIWRLVDPSDVEFDGDKLTGIDDAVAAVKEQYPSLFRPGGGSADGGSGSRNQNIVDMNTLLRRGAGRAVQ